MSKPEIEVEIKPEILEDISNRMRNLWIPLTIEEELDTAWEEELIYELEKFEEELNLLNEVKAQELQIEISAPAEFEGGMIFDELDIPNDSFEQKAIKFLALVNPQHKYMNEKELEEAIAMFLQNSKDESEKDAGFSALKYSFLDNLFDPYIWNRDGIRIAMGRRTQAEEAEGIKALRLKIKQGRF